ncbi:MAG: hypothetical protein H0T47_08155 [Planctomycetaceae bacterium]|nr:hypothetical protein [Planctomycetaceae bacterium]
MSVGHVTASFSPMPAEIESPTTASAREGPRLGRGETWKGNSIAVRIDNTSMTAVRAARTLLRDQRSRRLSASVQTPRQRIATADMNHGNGVADTKTSKAPSRKSTVATRCNPALPKAKRATAAAMIARPEKNA